MKKKVIFRCSKCGYESIRWMGRCSECGSWNSFDEVYIDKKSIGNRKESQKIKGVSPVKLHTIDVDDEQRIVSSIDEFNRVLGGGIIKDSVTILTARPGAGKSTLLLEIAKDI